MARIRTIKPEFPQSESMGRVSREARLLFILLWTICDDSGRARASSRLLASLLYPYDSDAPALIEVWLTELESEGCLRRYEVDSNTYVDVPNWLKHQKIDKPSQSRIPEFVETSRMVAKPREASALDLGPRKGPGPRTADLIPGAHEDEGFDSWWTEQPHQVAKPVARKAYRAALKKTSAAELLSGLRRYIATKPADQKWCNPATWLNQERWTDQPAAPSLIIGHGGAPSGPTHQNMSGLVDAAMSERKAS
ncbi:MAG: hypothetical protein EPO08_09110 [Rhodospirillaceae bacterium]|nr:MAG: hypothetical protein EPO08_09110 [Rhodospirillaceae bacterium]